MTPEQTAETPERTTRYEITFPEYALAQDEEWCLVRTGGSERRMRFHDYGDLFALPGLYEQLFYEHLECCSPTTVTAARAGAEAFWRGPGHTQRLPQ